jgi:hypothetical protein
MRLGDLTQALAPSALLENSNPIDIEWPPADMPAFQPGAAHACPHLLDDEIPFEFCDGADDDHDGSPERAAGIEVLAEADELDVEMVELVEHFEEMAHGPGDPVRGPDQEHLEAAAARIPKQIIETRPTSFHPYCTHAGITEPNAARPARQQSSMPYVNSFAESGSPIGVRR